jgi:two-component sensor histidine kinase
LPTSRGPVAGRLGVRLVAAVGLALMPLAIMAYLQSSRVQQEATARAEAALFGETMLAAAPQSDAIMRARGIASAMALAIERVVNDPETCATELRRLVDSDPQISFAGFVPADGMMVCASSGEPYSFADSPMLKGLLADPKPTLNVNRKGAITGESVLIVSNPVVTQAGAVLGIISLSVPHATLEPRSQPKQEGVASPLELVTFDQEGKLLTSLKGIDTAESRLPASMPLATLVSEGTKTFSAVTPSGERRVFALVPLVEGTLYALSSWLPTASSGFSDRLPLWVFPSAMWMASLLVAWLAAEYQVLRHVRALRWSMILFSRGNRAVEPPDLASAPNELRDVGDAYERMVDAVLHDEASLEDIVHQKEVLLREVHHRVKNNLQLIASIMNIQMRKAISPETRVQLKGLHDRIMALATVHRELYQTSGVTDVRADELLTTLVAQVLRMGSSPGRQFDLKTEFEPIRLTPDQSVPLSLLLTEALTNVLKHAGRGPDGLVSLSVSLKRAGEGRAVLRMANSVSENPVERTTVQGLESSGMGELLLQAFAVQLSGALASGPDGDGYAILVDFPLKALAEAEERFGAG